MPVASQTVSAALQPPVKILLDLTGLFNQKSVANILINVNLTAISLALFSKVMLTFFQAKTLELNFFDRTSLNIQKLSVNLRR